MAKRRQFEANMSREIESHLEQATQDYIARGLSPEEAHLRARREFGAIELAKEELRDTQRLSWLADFLQDARFTLRTWRRNPGFAAGVVAVLALGLGSTTALFSVLDRILFRPLPYADADRLVSFGELLPMAGGIAPREIMRDRAYFQLWQPAPEPFESVSSILGSGGPCDLTEERPERLSCAQVESNFLDVLGVRMLVGRNFTEEEDRRGMPPVAIVSYALWQRRLGGGNGSAGKTLQIDGKSVRIVGVLPAGFESPLGEPDLFMPEQLRPLDPNQRGTRFFTTIGRLKRGITPQQASAAIAPVIEAGGKLFPLDPKPKARVRNLRDLQVGDASRTAWLVLAASGVFLLIVCVNATGLLLARFAARSREFEMRAALGASKGRLARLALAESVLLAIGGGGLGVFFAWGLLKIFLRLAPTSIPKIEQASLDFRVFAVAAVLSLVCGVAIGLWPALSNWRAGTIGSGSRATSGLKPSARFALITTQVALTVGLLGASGLLLHSLWNLIRVPLGFESEQALTMTLILNAAHYPDAQSQTALFEQLLARVQEAPGTIAASWSNTPPLSTFATTSGLRVDGAATAREGGILRLRYATPGYFETFRVSIVRGRAFAEADRDEQPTAILSERAERILFPGQSSIGHTVKSPFSDTWHEVVGVVRDVRNGGLTRDGEAEVYLIRDRGAESQRSGVIGLRTTLNSADATGELKQVLAGLDPQLPSTVKTVTEQVAALTARPRFLAVLLAAFAGLALFVAAVGLYAVASFLVTQRTRDIGVRMALGASSARIAKEVGGEAFYWIAAGAGLGYGLAQLAARVLAAELFNVSASDAPSWAGTVGALAAAFLLALIPPMRRAGRVDPAIALRAE